MGRDARENWLVKQRALFFFLFCLNGFIKRLL